MTTKIYQISTIFKLATAAVLLLIMGSPAGAAGRMNGKIVFTRAADSWPSHIYIMNLDGSGLTRLSAPTNTPIDTDPVWSPDGQKIAFASGGFNDLSDIFVMNADGTNRVQLTDGGSYLTYETSFAPAWSPNGSKIAFYGTRAGQNVALFVMNSDGTNVSRIYENSGGCSRPSWSPDGIQIAFHCEGGYAIRTFNTLDGSLKTITGSSWYDWEVASPAWSPDGSMIAYLRTPYEGYYGSPNIVNEIWMIDLNSLATWNLTNTSDVIEGSPTWLPDGSGIVFPACCGPDGGNWSIYKINKDGTGTTRLSNPPVPSISDWSPSVQSLPYIKRRSRQLRW